MIKVKHTKTHEVLCTTRGGMSGSEDVLVTDAELVLVEDGNGEYISRVQLGTGNGFCKPILISRKEKIEVGDWYYEEGKGITQDLGEHELVIEAGYKEKKTTFKILALSEHFSPQQLQDIVDGKLKEGDEVLVECEEISSISDVKDIQKKPNGDTFIPTHTQIKLNPHITIYPVEEKIVDFFKIEDLRPYLLRHPDKEMVRVSCLHYLGDRFQDFDQIPVEEKMYTREEVKAIALSAWTPTDKYSFNEWFETNIK